MLCVLTISVLIPRNFVFQIRLLHSYEDLFYKDSGFYKSCDRELASEWRIHRNRQYFHLLFSDYSYEISYFLLYKLNKLKLEIVNLKLLLYIIYI